MPVCVVTEMQGTQGVRMGYTQVTVTARNAGNVINACPNPSSISTSNIGLVVAARETNSESRIFQKRTSYLETYVEIVFALRLS